MAAVAKMKLTAIVPWFGSKRTLAPQVIDEIGDHGAYWEPFCGSMAVLLAKAPCPMEVVNDLHGDLVNLARVIQHEKFGAQLYRRLRRVLMHETFFNDQAVAVRSYANSPVGADPDVDRAFAYFICSWMGRNGVSGTQSYNQGFCRRFTSNGGHGAKRWNSAVESIPAWRWRLRNVQIFAMDAFDMLAAKGGIEDKKGTVIYCDPPYFTKGAKYVHDFVPMNDKKGRESDHERLAALLQRFEETKVVVSYYDDPHLDVLYPSTRWSKIQVPVRKSLSQGLKAQGESNEAVAPEVLLVNRVQAFRELF